MITKTFTVQFSSQIPKKIEELTRDGWDIISIVDTSRPYTPPDEHGASYGGSEISIVAKREYEKPSVMASSVLRQSMPCDMRGIGGRR